MSKPVIVITHERSGTHLLINCINYTTKGQFCTIGYTPNRTEYNIKGYMHNTYKSVMSNAYTLNTVFKSHHQVEFMTEYLDFLFNKYKVIYVKRNIEDVLNSYYKFIVKPEHRKTLSIEDWIFSNPDIVTKKYTSDYFPDPHVLIEPENYVHRWHLHTSGWLKYSKQMLVINYENMLLDYQNQKIKIEDYIGKKIADRIPDINDKSFPNYGIVKGVIGDYKTTMTDKVINDINQQLSVYTGKPR